jgi:hypothetical protein
VPPYAAQPPADGQYAGVQHPATPDQAAPNQTLPHQTVPYPQAQYPNPPYPTPPYANPQYPGAPGPSAGYDPGAYSPANYPAGFSPSGAPAPKKPGGLGLVALLLSLVAAVVAPIVGAVAAFQVGAGTWSWSRYETMPSNAWPDLSFLSPVREWVLLGEIAFWAGTVLGIWAIVQGIVAIAKRRGIGTGIAAIVVAVLAVFIFGAVVYGAAIAGVVTGTDLGTTSFSA